MDLRQIESVVAVPEEMHFGRAADRLFVSTSVVSQHVSALERELGVRLFERSTRNVRITEAGRSVLLHARAVLAAVNAMKGVTRNQAGGGGELTIAYRPSAGELVATLTADFRREHPGTEVVLLVMTSREVIEAVRNGKVMFGIAQAASDGLDSFVLAHEPLGCLAVHRDHPLSSRDSVCVADLTGQRYIVSQEREYADLHDEIVGFFADVGVSPVFTSFPARREQDVLDLVGAGLGSCLLRTSLVSRRGGGNVVRRPVEGPVPMFHYVLVWRSGEMSLLARSFAEYARVSRATSIEEVGFLPAHEVPQHLELRSPHLG